jgi:PiT family inorganic phosphate transporter
MTACTEFVAPFLFGVAVANTAGKGLIEPAAISTSVVMAAVIAAILWNLITWFFGIPSSSSHALGLLAGYLFMSLVRLVFRLGTRNVNWLFKRLQMITALGLALSHGSNDAQKTMGIITLGLVTAGFQSSFYVPLWVIALSAGAIALGTALGGWRLIRTLGGRIYKIRAEHAFSSQAASATVILGAALLGGPVSTTQVVGSAIMGAGAAER